MYKFITTIYLAIVAITVHAQSVSIDSNAKATEPKTVSIKIRCGSTTVPEPLYIIDGYPASYQELKQLDVNSIENISILKTAAAQALYGCRASSGVVIINTKATRLRSFQIREIGSGHPVRGATVSFKPVNDNNDALLIVASDSGELSTDQLKEGEEYRVSISTAGYKTLSVSYVNDNRQPLTFSMESNWVDCPPVKVKGVMPVANRKTHICGRSMLSDCVLLCKLSGIVIYAGGKEDSAMVNNKKVFRIYPNPLRAGAVVITEIIDETETVLQVKIFDISGKLLVSQQYAMTKGTNRLQIATDSRWPAGVYFVQLTNGQGKLIKQEKLLIQ